MLLQAKDKVYWETELNVKELSNKQDFVDDVLRRSHKKQRYEYLLVRNVTAQSSHCMYVKTYHEATDEVECINSDGSKNNPRINLRLATIYRVSCSAVRKNNSNPNYKPDLDSNNKAKVIKTKWSKTSHIPTIDEVTEAAKLAKLGYLRSVDRLVLKNIDVSSIEIGRAHV